MVYLCHCLVLCVNREDRTPKRKMTKRHNQCRALKNKHAILSASVRCPIHSFVGRLEMQGTADHETVDLPCGTVTDCARAVLIPQSWTPSPNAKHSCNRNLKMKRDHSQYLFPQYILCTRDAFSATLTNASEFDLACSVLSMQDYCLLLLHFGYANVIYWAIMKEDPVAFELPELRSGKSLPDLVVCYETPNTNHSATARSPTNTFTQSFTSRHYELSRFGRSPSWSIDR